jgi:GNAT superfamily N-acetyltransferase
MPGYEAVAGLSPWIKGLYVDEPARRHGCGALLMARCETWAAGLGHESLYLYTERGSGAEQFYKYLRWQVIHHDQYDGMAVSIMRKSLSSLRP